MLHSKMYHFSLFFLQHYLYRFYNITARDLNDTVYENTQMPRPTIILQTFLLPFKVLTVSCSMHTTFLLTLNSDPLVHMTVLVHSTKYELKRKSMLFGTAVISLCSLAGLVTVLHILLRRRLDQGKYATICNI